MFVFRSCAASWLSPTLLNFLFHFSFYESAAMQVVDLFLFFSPQTSTSTCLYVLLKTISHNCFSSPLIEFIQHHHIHLFIQLWLRVHSLQNFYQWFFWKTFILLLIALNVHNVSLVSLLNSNCGNFFYLNCKAYTWTILAACCLVMSTMLSSGLLAFWNLVEAIAKQWVVFVWIFTNFHGTGTEGNKFWLYSLFSVFLLPCYLE